MLEKTADHILHLDRLNESFPDAQILYITRDGRDVATSIQERYRHLTFARASDRWVRANKHGVTHLLGNSKAYHFRYEDLVDNPFATLQGVFRFLNITEVPSEVRSRIQNRGYERWSNLDPVLEKPSAEGYGNAAYRSWQINQPLFDGRGRWKNQSDADLTQLFNVRA